MSADFPNRARWLALRNTPRKLPITQENYTFISRPLMWSEKEKKLIFAQRRGLTAKGGRKKIKRALFALKLAKRKARHDAKMQAKNNPITICNPSPSVT